MEDPVAPPVEAAPVAPEALVAEPTAAVEEVTPLNTSTEGAETTTASAENPPSETPATTEPAKPPVTLEEALPQHPLKTMRTYSLTEDAEVNAAKAFLTQTSDQNQLNLYDHMVNVLVKILERKPQNAVDVFESISADVKQSQFHPESYESPSSVQRAKESSFAIELARTQKELFSNEKSGETIGDLPDIMDLSNLFEWAGVTFGEEETYLVSLSIKKLVEEKSCKSVRLFGKMFGSQKNYYIVESERGDGEEGAADEEEPAAPAKPESDDPNEQDLPKSNFKVTPPVPKEIGVGVNKYVYWVCTVAGGEWTRLPDVTPKQIQVSRSIRKLFSGDLNKKIVSYPPFQGTEAHLLRAQIARIASATVISPAGYYKFDDEEEPQEGVSPPVVLNTEFEWPTHEALLQADSWAHHIPYILPQGRTTYVNPNPPKENDGDEGDEGKEEQEEEPIVEPETGPAILTPIAEDSEVGTEGISTWTIRLAAPLSPARYSPVFLRNNRWPGAYTVGFNDKFANVYVGWGLKELGRPYSAPALPAVQVEYGNAGGPGAAEDIVEKSDPTLEEEQAYNDANKKDDEPGEDGDQGEEEA